MHYVQLAAQSTANLKRNATKVRGKLLSKNFIVKKGSDDERLTRVEELRAHSILGRIIVHLCKTYAYEKSYIKKRSIVR